MYLLVSFITIVLCSHTTSALARQAGSEKTFRDPFIPLYVTDPKNEYEKQLAERVRYRDVSAVLPEMYVCEVSDEREKRYVMYSGKIYYEGDRYLSGVITDINCDHIVITSDDTIIMLRLYDEDIISSVGVTSV